MNPHLFLWVSTLSLPEFFTTYNIYSNLLYLSNNLLIIKKMLTNKSHQLNVYMKAYRLFL